MRYKIYQKFTSICLYCDGDFNSKDINEIIEKMDNHVTKCLCNPKLKNCLSCKFSYDGPNDPPYLECENGIEIPATRIHNYIDQCGSYRKGKK